MNYWTAFCVFFVLGYLLAEVRYIKRSLNDLDKKKKLHKVVKGQ